MPVGVFPQACCWHAQGHACKKHPQRCILQSCRGANVPARGIGTRTSCSKSCPKTLPGQLAVGRHVACQTGTRVQDAPARRQPGSDPTRAQGASCTALAPALASELGP